MKNKKKVQKIAQKKKLRTKKTYKSIAGKIIGDFLRYNLIWLGIIIVFYIIGHLYFSQSAETYNIFFNFVAGKTNTEIAEIISSHGYILILAAFFIVFILNCFLFSVTTLINFNKTYRSLNAFLSDRDEIASFSKSYSEVELKLKDIQLEIVESKHLASQLENKKNDLVMYLAHDLKTPLTSVIGYLTLLEECPELSQSQRAKFRHCP